MSHGYDLDILDMTPIFRGKKMTPVATINTAEKKSKLYDRQSVVISIWNTRSFL